MCVTSVSDLNYDWYTCIKFHNLTVVLGDYQVQDEILTPNSKLFQLHSISEIYSWYITDWNSMKGVITNDNIFGAHMRENVVH